MKIHLLPEQVINQIAAGEVVERPASVVRELMDNSLDAGANDLLIELEQGGQQLIRVVDNGVGMEREDALLAFQRHATSKVSTSEDLINIETYGFRGEALSSIASVSRVVLRTRTSTDKLAVELCLQGGVLSKESLVAASVGTMIEVRDLFFNTPARKKFLKTPRGEAARIKQLILQSSIAHPDVRYRLMVDGEESLVIPRSKSVIERGLRLMSGAPVVVDYEEDEVSVIGAVAHPAVAASDANSFVVLVNKRLVVDKVILRAVRDGFQSTLKDREYPVGFVVVGMPPEQVDINVHPQKSEVRFRDSQSVFRAVRRAVERAVSQLSGPIANPIALNTFSEQPPSYQVAANSGQIPPADSLNRPNPGFWNQPQSSVMQSPRFDWLGIESREEPKLEKFRYSEIKIIGQVLDCYILGQLDDQLVIVDMHAAHERYNYNLIRNGLREKRVQSQELLVPEVVKVGPEGVERCLEELETLEKAGFKISPYGEDAMLVSSIPAVLQFKGAAKVLSEVASSDSPDKGMSAIEGRTDAIAARMACHSSIRSGDRLSLQEMQALMDALDRSEFSAACPHGRPVIVAFNRDQVERWFGRDR